MSSAAHRLRHVLAGQPFPAERWQLIVGAEFYGADAQTRCELQALPPRRYLNLAEVLSTIDGTGSASAAAASPRALPAGAPTSRPPARSAVA